MNWFRLDLGDALLAERRIHELRSRAQSAYADAGRPSGWAVYLQHVSGELHCRAVVIFSPQAAQWARLLGAVPCAAPDHRPDQLAGDERWSD